MSPNPDQMWIYFIQVYVLNKYKKIDGKATTTTYKQGVVKIEKDFIFVQLCIWNVH